MFLLLHHPSSRRYSVKLQTRLNILQTRSSCEAVNEPWSCSHGVWGSSEISHFISSSLYCVCSTFWCKPCVSDEVETCSLEGVCDNCPASCLVLWHFVFTTVSLLTLTNRHIYFDCSSCSQLPPELRPVVLCWRSLCRQWWIRLVRDSSQMPDVRRCARMRGMRRTRIGGRERKRCPQFFFIFCVKMMTKNK